ncbi:MAG: S8 family serine peptidase [Solirubrobacterales bacterium]
MRRLLRTLLPLAALVASLAASPPAGAATALAPSHGFAPRKLLVKLEGQRLGRTLSLPPGAGVRSTAKALRRNPRVVYAEPDYVATASSIRAEPFDPDDPGTIGAPFEPSSLAYGWASKQWNFLASEGAATPRLPTSPGGIDAVGAWRNLIEAGRPGAQGTVVAVLDTGIAYRSFDGVPKSPDFSPSQFVPGYDFIGHDRLPLDTNGHGTHVAGTIAEQTDNGIGLTGLAYRAKLMPVRVLNRKGVGLESQIAQGIRYAVVHHADVINMSFNFECEARLPMVNEALRFAYRRGVVTVASGGNLEPPKPGKATVKECVSAPATGPHVIAVGGTTQGACIGDYSLAGAAIDLVAPGGGKPREGCPSILHRPIYQVTFRPQTTEFGIPRKYVGTSMAAAHVSGVAAMVLASGVLGPQPRPEAKVKAVLRQLRRTARDLGYPRTLQGAGLIDAARATEAPAL